RDGRRGRAGDLHSRSEFTVAHLVRHAPSESRRDRQFAEPLARADRLHGGCRVTVAYDALLASATPDFVVLAEAQPMEMLGGWTAAGGGLTNTYYCTFLSQIQ